MTYNAIVSYRFFHNDNLKVLQSLGISHKSSWSFNCSNYIVSCLQSKYSVALIK